MGRPFVFLQERVDRLWFLLVQAFTSRGRRFRWIVRIASLAVAAFAVTQLVPTLADEAAPPPNQAIISPESQESDSVVVLSSGDDLLSGGDNSAVTADSDSQVTYSTLETETARNQEPEIALADDQSISVRIPSTIKVDPRAVTALLPNLSLSSEEKILICLQAPALRFDTSTKGFVDDAVEDQFIAEGDLTNSLRISGSYPRVVAFLNGEGGVRVWSNQGAIAGKALVISAVALSGPSVDSTFCGQGMSQSVTFRALGLGMNTKKGGVRLD